MDKDICKQLMEKICFRINKFLLKIELTNLKIYLKNINVINNSKSIKLIIKSLDVHTISCIDEWINSDNILYLLDKKKSLHLLKKSTMIPSTLFTPIWHIGFEHNNILLQFIKANCCFFSYEDTQLANMLLFCPEYKELVNQGCIYNGTYNTGKAKSFNNLFTGLELAFTYNALDLLIRDAPKNITIPLLFNISYGEKYKEIFFIKVLFPMIIITKCMQEYISTIHFVIFDTKKEPNIKEKHKMIYDDLNMYFPIVYNDTVKRTYENLNTNLPSKLAQIVITKIHPIHFDIKIVDATDNPIKTILEYMLARNLLYLDL